MAPRGYATHLQVASYLGVTFTAAQTIEAELLIEAAEHYVDARTGRVWLSDAVTDEAYYAPYGPLLFLRRAPLASATVTIKARAGVSATETTLTVTDDYEVEDLATGRIRIPGALSYDRIRVTYTPVAAIDQVIALAVKQLVGFWLRPSLTGSSDRLRSIAFGSDLRMEYADVVKEGGVPPEVAALLASKSRVAVFA